MKKISLFVLCLLVLFSSVCFAMPNFTYSSGIVNSDQVISPVPCLLTDVAVYTDGTNNATVVLYDAKSATGTVIGKVTVIGASLNGGIIIPVPVKARIGVYMDITGTGASAIIFTTPE